MRENGRSPELLLLPGMGADERLFGGLSCAFRVPAWPRPSPDESLRTFAARIASELTDRPAVVGGASFGGMVACELATQVQAKAVVLIGSCTSPSGVAAPLRVLGRAATRFPESAFKPRHSTARLFLAAADVEAHHRALLWSMASVVPPSFVRWACTAVLDWRPSPMTVPIFHIHGARDRLIPIRHVQATEVVPDGGHFLTLTHPTEVSAFVEHAVGALPRA